MQYESKAIDDHVRKEEEQWAAILEAGDPLASMLLLNGQKLCAVVHEYRAAARAGVEFPPDLLERRLGQRIDKVLEIGEQYRPELASLEHFRRLKEFLDTQEGSNGRLYHVRSDGYLNHVVEQAHAASHALADELYATRRPRGRVEQDQWVIGGEQDPWADRIEQEPPKWNPILDKEI